MWTRCIGRDWRIKNIPRRVYGEWYQKERNTDGVKCMLRLEAAAVAAPALRYSNMNKLKILTHIFFDIFTLLLINSLLS